MDYVMSRRLTGVNPQILYLQHSSSSLEFNQLVLYVDNTEF